MKKLIMAIMLVGCICWLSACADYSVLEPISQQARQVDACMGTYSSAGCPKFHQHSSAHKWAGFGEIMHGLTGGRE